MSTAAPAAVRERPIIFSGPMVRAILAGEKTQTRRLVKPRNSTSTGRAANPKNRAHKYFNGWEGLEFTKAFTDGHSRDRKPHGLFGVGRNEGFSCGEYLHVPLEDDQRVYRIRSRVEPGDRLWVRETWAAIWPQDCDDGRIYDDDSNEGGRPITLRECDIEYRADTNGAKYPGHWDDAEPEDAKHDAPRWRSPIHMPRLVSRVTLEVTGVRVERVQEDSVICKSDWVWVYEFRRVEAAPPQ